MFWNIAGMSMRAVSPVQSPQPYHTPLTAHGPRATAQWAGLQQSSPTVLFLSRVGQAPGFTGHPTQNQKQQHNPNQKLKTPTTPSDLDDLVQNKKTKTTKNEKCQMLMAKRKKPEVLSVSFSKPSNGTSGKQKGLA